MRNADEERDLVVAFLAKRAAKLKHTSAGSRHRSETVRLLALDIAEGKHRPEYEAPRHKQCCCRWGAAVKGEWPEFGCYKCEIHQGGFGEQPDELCKRHAREDIAALLQRSEEVMARSRLAQANIIYVDGDGNVRGS